MLSHLYENTVLKNPKAIFLLLIITLLSFSYFSKDFRLRMLLIELSEVKASFGVKVSTKKSLEP